VQYQNAPRAFTAEAALIDRHQTNGFQRPMIKTAPISSHAAVISPHAVQYNRNVVLLTNW
jgi:hypothetical protein